MLIKNIIPKFLKQKLSIIKNMIYFINVKRVDEKNLVQSIKKKKLTFLSYSRLFQLIKSLKEVEKKKIDGSFIETGVALGGTLALVAGYSKQRTILAFDTFEMIPPPTDNDPPEVHERYQLITQYKAEGIEGDIYYGYRDNLFNFVSMQLDDLIDVEARNRTKLIKGLLQETMNLNKSVAFAHIDVDYYDPVKSSISQIWPLLSKGGIVIFDDYLDWGGCKKAVDEFFSDKKNFRFDLSCGNLKVVKTD